MQARLPFLDNYFKAVKHNCPLQDARTPAWRGNAEPDISDPNCHTPRLEDPCSFLAMAPNIDRSALPPFSWVSHATNKAERL